VRVLIVKTSSLGDIVQSFVILSYLHEKFKNLKIDWVVEKNALSLLRSHPLVNRAILFDLKKWKKNFLKKSTYEAFFRFKKILQYQKYDVVFDLQGNIKSSIVTFFSRSKKKVGFSKKFVKEWPNLLFTNEHIDIDNTKNIRFQYLQLIKSYFKDKSEFNIKPYLFKILKKEDKKIDKILSDKNIQKKYKIIVAPHSRMASKELKQKTLIDFLKNIDKKFDVSFLFIWGSEKEKKISQTLKNYFENSYLVPKLSMQTLQHLINKVDFLIAVDSCVLHLSDSSQASIFGIFGPTRAKIFEPITKDSFSYQMKCCQKLKFIKTCPLLRSKKCDCMKLLKAKDLYDSFISIIDAKNKTC
jgi:lipopolysaccharide heptosyltransferase I